MDILLLVNKMPNLLEIKFYIVWAITPVLANPNPLRPFPRGPASYWYWSKLRFALQTLQATLNFGFRFNFPCLFLLSSPAEISDILSLTELVSCARDCYAALVDPILTMIWFCNRATVIFDQLDWYDRASIIHRTLRTRADLASDHTTFGHYQFF